MARFGWFCDFTWFFRFCEDWWFRFCGFAWLMLLGLRSFLWVLAVRDLGFAFGGWWFAGFGGVFVWFRVDSVF